MPWTFEQWMHLLAVLAWPAVAVIAGAAWVHGCRLLVESTDTVVRCLDNSSSKWSRVALQGLARWAAAQPPMPTHYVNPEKAQVTATCERALLAVLAARGGFPAKQSEEPGRALVRAIREMYGELDRPTPRPEPTAVAGVAGWSGELETVDGMDGLDGETVDDLYAQFVATDDDAAQPTNDEMEDLE